MELVNNLSIGFLKVAIILRKILNQAIRGNPRKQKKGYTALSRKCSL